MKVLGLDVGDRYIGLAVSDELLLFAQGAGRIERVGIRKDAGKVMDKADELGCDTIVVGLPLNLSGKDSPQTEKVRAFGTMLENKLKSTGQKVRMVYQDERLSTVEAERILIAGDVRREKRREIIDQQAAVIILQSYLDRSSNRERERMTDA